MYVLQGSAEAKLSFANIFKLRKSVTQIATGVGRNNPFFELQAVESLINTINK